jgi:hypothetical protein
MKNVIVLFVCNHWPILTLLQWQMTKFIQTASLITIHTVTQTSHTLPFVTFHSLIWITEK